MKKYYFLTVMALLLGASLVASSLNEAEAGLNQWTQYGPAATGVFGLAQNPNNPAIVYAAGETGVFKSTDGGVSWAEAGLAGKYIYDVATDPQDPAKVFAAARLWGLYKSLDGGVTWELTSVTDPYVYNLFIDPLNQNVIYAGAFEDLYKSVDGGAVWESVFKPTNNYVLTTALDPDDHSVVYVGTGFLGAGQGVYRFKASDGWKYLGLNGFDVYIVTFDPNDSSTIYAGTYGGALFRSPDKGITWTRVGYGYPETTVAYNGDTSGQYSDMATLGANLDYTKGLTDRYIWDIEFDTRTNPTSIYAATDQGVFKSNSGATKWWPINEGLTDLNIKTLLLSDAYPTNLLAGSWHQGVFGYSDDSSAPALFGKVIDFQMGTQAATGLTDNSGFAAAALKLMQPAGLYNIDAHFTGDQAYPAASAILSFLIRKEDTAITYTGDTIVRRNQALILKAVLSELDTSIGDLSNKPVTFVISNGTQSQTVAGTTDVNGLSMISGTLNLPAGLYDVSVEFGGDNYYLASSSPGTPLIIWESMPGLNVDGGGFVVNGNAKINFGFTAKFLNNSDTPQGQFEYIDRDAGINIHSRSIDWLLAVGNLAWFGGTATVNGSGSHGFMVYLQDGGTPGIGKDYFQLTLDGNTLSSRSLSGGNIIIH